MKEKIRANTTRQTGHNYVMLLCRFKIVFSFKFSFKRAKFSISDVQKRWIFTDPSNTNSHSHTFVYTSQYEKCTQSIAGIHLRKLPFNHLSVDSLFSKSYAWYKFFISFCFSFHFKQSWCIRNIIINGHCVYGAKFICI